MSQQRVLIVAARRTPFGRFRGRLSNVSPASLVTAAGEAACDGLDRGLINQVIVGQVLAAGHGMNVARQTALSLGFRESSTAMTVNMMCGSGLKALALGVQAIRRRDPCCAGGRRGINVTITAAGAAARTWAATGPWKYARFDGYRRFAGRVD